MSDEGCEHYKRRCIFLSPCCGNLYPCRLCHDEKENHQINRFLVNHIKCSSCDTTQKVQQSCEKCNVTFGKYFCEKCRLYDDNDKGQFHCDKCGLCRVGGADNFFHCDKCDLCLKKTMRDNHKCVEKASRSNCPVCMEDLHSSTVPVQVPSCSHLLHQHCYQEMLKNGNYRCPTCGESMVEMEKYWEALDREVANTPMPAEYSDTYIHSLCKDCHKVSRSLFHVLGQKCQECGSYNTCGADGPEGGDTTQSTAEGS